MVFRQDEQDLQDEKKGGFAAKNLVNFVHPV